MQMKDNEINWLGLCLVISLGNDSLLWHICTYCDKLIILQFDYVSNLNVHPFLISKPVIEYKF